jgi:UPF0755 protein
MPILIRILKYVLLSAVLAILFLAGWFTFEFNALTAPRETLHRLQVEEGRSVTGIAQILAEQKLIRRRWPFVWGYRLFYSGQSLKAGEYLLESPLSPKQILQTLIKGQILLYPITIPEGLTRREIALHLQQNYGTDPDAFLSASLDPVPVREWDETAVDLEGYLFPETYHVPKDTTAEQMVLAMLNQFRLTFTEDWKQRAEELGLSVRDTVILASLIEKETSRPEERELVSAVFHNRLRINMKLDCDPTIVYALKTTDSYTGRLRYKDLKLDSPYNTYLYPGLPPGPIANPGRAALEAALYPEDVEYLYFVSRNDGSHQFSRTYREHVNAVNKYQRRRSP